MGSGTAVPTPTVERHLQSWIGGWPPSSPVKIVSWPDSIGPAWDGRNRLATGAVDSDGNVVVGVAPAVAAALPDRIAGIDELRATMPDAVGRPGVLGLGALRWGVDVPGPDELPDVGVWLPAALANDPDDQRVDTWLAPFGGDVLVALDDDGKYLGGVGLKRHNDLGREIAVVTAEAARGRGIARRLVAQAARRVLADGMAVTYLHAHDNIASAHVARASGFPDTGWQIVGWFERDPTS
ncbi:MAG: GNAT family N-acetyltransferase [Ilumatobacteraceae bacterium]|nr:GNAT family N-acetyltransferase [Ilumatobacteraceae bacterium]